VLVNAVRVPDNWQRRQALVLGISLLLLGMLAAALLPMRVTAPWAVEATVAGSAILAAGGLTLMIRLMHRRQLRLTPQPIWSAGESTATTALLETTEPSFSAGDGQSGRS
jgi:predicted benzoate:H+ symporter BenE